MYYTIIKLIEEANIKINAANNINKINEVRIRYFGKKGKLTLQLKHIKSYDKPIIGEAINKTKKTLYKKFKYHNKLLEKETIKNKIAKEKIDVTLTGRCGENIVKLHPITRTLYRIKKIFINIGYKLVEGPEIEDEFHNFEALNMPRNHPARAMHDTFYFNSNYMLYMLRSHTSSILIRTMEKQNPPLRVIGAGKVYRCDSDLNHSPMFHQVEGLLVDEVVSFSDLKGTIDIFIKCFFEGQKIEVRFRPSYFPFTEPSAEVDIRIKPYSDWLEVIGCGLIQPNILKRLKINPKYYGFAFGMGAERLTMLRYGIKDLRTLFNNDIRILRQF